MAADAKETTGVKVPFRSSISLLRTYLKPHWFKMSLLALLLYGQIANEGTLSDLLESSDEMRQLWEREDGTSYA